MIRENFSNTIQRGTEKFTFSSQNQGKGTAKVFQSENEAINFVAQFFSRSDSQSLQLLGELNNVSGFQSLSPLKPEERLPAQAKHLGKLLYQQQLFCSVEVSAPPISSSVSIELEYSEPEEEKRPSDGKAEEEQNENATSDEDTPVSAKEHETGGDPVSMVTGEELLSLDDFTSASGLVWTRHYRSSKCEQSVGLGLGWRHSFLLEFSETHDEEGEVASWKFVDDMGDAIEFPPVGKGATSYQVKAGSSCLNHKNGYRVITLPDGNQYKFLKHHEDWKLSQIRENALKQIDLRYSSNGRLIEVQTNGVSDLCCQYDKEGKLVGLRCPHTDKLVVEYDIDEYDHLIGASDQNGLQEKYTYTDSALLLTRQRPSGFTHYFEWQGEGAKAKCVRNFGDEGIYDYRFEFGETESSYQDTLGHTWQFKHDGNGKLLEKVSPEGRKSVWEYDDLGRLSKESEPNGTYKKRYYNEFGQLAAIQHSSGAKTEYQYDSYGVLSAVIHPDGEVSKREVNSLGQLIWSQNPSQVSTQYQYDKKGRLIETASSQGSLKRWWWGEENRIQGIQINHSLIRYSYNAENRVNGLAYPDGMYVTLEHNAHGQLTRQRTFHDFDKSVSREHTYDYDDAGRITSIITPNGSTKFEWGTLNQPDSLIKQDGSGLSFEYDAERNLTAINRSDNASYQLSLSPDGQLIETKGFDGVQNQYAYDDNGQINAVISGQRAIHVEYNQHGDMASISARNEGYFNESHFQHSFGGKLLTASNSSRAIKNQFDPHGLLTEEWQSNYLIQNHYNHQKLCEKKTLPNGDELHFDYSEFGELTGVTYQSQSKLEQSPAKVTIDYDNMARVQTLQYGNAQSELRTYDGLGRLKQQDWGTRNRHYRYDVSDNLASSIDSELGHHHYHYDALSQLTRVKTPDEVFKFRFDSFGNPESEESLVEHDRLIEHGGLRYQYDDQGNQIRVSGGDSLQRREFNALNQLVMVNHNGKLAHYEYDALGRRSKKTTESGTTEFIWQGSQLIGEISANHYRWYVYLPKSHAPLMLIENGLCFFYQNDHLGTPVRLVDTSGNVVWQASYNPLGQASIDIEEVRNPLRFQGQYFDEESGLHYNLARYYDPYSGRFIQPDPIGLLGGINHYQYAPNPVMWIDPMGMCAKEESCLVPTGAEKTSQIENEVVKELSGGALDSSIDFYAPFKYIGGITKATGDSITSSVEYVLENPMESLEQTAVMLENGAQFVVDSVNYFPDALILEPLSDLTGYQLSVGARARNDKLINDTIESISSDISEHAKAIDAGDYVKAGGISAGYVLAATPLGRGAYDVAKNYRIVPNIPEPGQLNSNPIPLKLKKNDSDLSKVVLSKEGTSFIDPKYADCFKDQNRIVKVNESGKAKILFGKKAGKEQTIILSKNAGQTETRKGITLKRDKNGFPIFNSKFDTFVPDDLLGNQDHGSHFEHSNSRVQDALKANPRLADEMGLTPEQVKHFLREPPYKAPPEGLTWHHHQDTGRMQLVQLSEHEAFVPHTGGMSIWGGGYKR